MIFFTLSRQFFPSLYLVFIILRCSGPDWYEFGEFCYKPFEVKKTWHDARRACRALGAELVSILSMTEHFVCVNTLIYFFLATSDVWTGLNDLGLPGMFSWSNEHMVTFTYWAPGEPNSHDGFSEDCVEMLHQVGWIPGETLTLPSAGQENECTSQNTSFLFTYR
uniref:C-type lectin domain-containing protein n=1 Tax=Mastacembelus armatus TaxID=205130 RepID=A0A7N8Y369_9TELE